MTDRTLYVASRASVPERSQMWRALRYAGHPIISTWIDEAGEGETECNTELWARIHREIGQAHALVLFAEASDFPLKGALVEVGMALGMRKRVVCCLPRVELQEHSCRPLGSWFKHPLVSREDNIVRALEMALQEHRTAQAPAVEE